MNKLIILKYKKLFLFTILGLLFLTKPVLAASGNVVIFTVGSTKYLVDGESFFMSTPPCIQDSTVLLPIRYVTHALGIPDNNISFDDGKLIITKDDEIVKFNLNSNTIVTINGQIMLPARWISEVLGVYVKWDEIAHTVTIMDNDYQNDSIDSSSINLMLSSKIATQNVPSFTYPEFIKVTGKNYQWQYNNITYKWRLEIPNDLLDWDREVYDLIDKFYHSNGYAQHNILSSVPNSLKEIILSTTLISNNNHTPFVDEQNNSLYVKYLADSLSEQANFDGYDYFYAAEFAQSFVGGAIPYMKSDIPKLPVQTLVDNGDCTDKSILLAAILKNMGYNVALLFFPGEDNQDGHLAIGIEFSDIQIPTNRDLIYYLHDGIKYYFTETTSPGWGIGELSNSNYDKAFVYPIN